MCSKRDQVALHVGIYCTARDATRQREYSELNQPLCENYRRPSSRLVSYYTRRSDRFSLKPAAHVVRVVIGFLTRYKLVAACVFWNGPWNMAC